MLYFVTGDLVNDKHYDFFCHQTDCHDQMEYGIAKRIADTYPIVAARDRQYHKLYAEGFVRKILGTILGNRTEDGRTCINMYARDGLRTDYMAFARCLALIRDDLCDLPDNVKVAFPDHIGCDIANGDWNIIRNLIEAFSRMIRQDVYIVRQAEVA